MSPDRKRGPDGGPERRVHDEFLRKLFEKTQPELEAKASESMPRDLDELFEKQVSRSDLSSTAEDSKVAALLLDLFSSDLQHDSQMGSPARLDSTTASKLDLRVAEGIRQTDPQEKPLPIQLTRAPQWAGLAAAGLIGMLYIWGQGYLSSDPNGDSPLFVLVDVDRPLDTSMDPAAISLAAAGAIDFVEGLPPSKVQPKKKGGEE